MTSEKSMENSKFPILIKYKDTDDLVIVNKPNDIDHSRTFVVVKTSQKPGRKAG